MTTPITQPGFCGCSENLLELARTGNYRWNKRDLAFCIVDRVTRISQADFEAVIEDGYLEWAKHCDLTFTRVKDQRQADLLVLARRIDGRGGILAEHQLPPGNNMQIRGWLDLGEAWTLGMLAAVWKHELGHGLGLSHTDTPNSLMNPFYNPAIATPQQWDIDAVQKLYGPAKPKAAPQPPSDFPVPTPGKPSITGMIEIPPNTPSGIYTVNFVRES